MWVDAKSQLGLPPQQHLETFVQLVTLVRPMLASAYFEGIDATGGVRLAMGDKAWTFAPRAGERGLDVEGLVAFVNSVLRAQSVTVRCGVFAPEAAIVRVACGPEQELVAIAKQATIAPR